MVAVAPFDFQVHDTYFIVAHLHYTLIGGMLFPVMGGIWYFYPFVTGRRLGERLGIWAFWLMFAGFNIAFLPMHLTGLLGMPRRVFTYGAERGWDWLNLMSTAGAFVFAAGFLVLVWDCVRPKQRPRRPLRNPWRAGTLEWLTPLPAPSYGLRAIPDVNSRYPLWDDRTLAARVARGEGYLPDAQEGRRETLVTTVLDAQPLQVLRVGGPTWMPMLAAAGLGGVFIFATWKLWLPALVSGLFFLVVLLRWLWTGTAPIPEKETKDIGDGTRLPLHAAGPYSSGWWAMFITLTGDLTAFLSLIFGYFFFWTVHADFPPAGIDGPGWQWPLVAAVLVAASWSATLAARRRNAAGDARAARLLLAVGLAAGAASVVALLAGPWATGLDPTAHSYPAIVWALATWIALHIGAGLIMQGYCIARSVFGRITPRHDADLWNVTLYWHFTTASALLTALVVGGFPEVA
jgi:cytochrome c oxidase subunit I+III